MPVWYLAPVIAGQFAILYGMFTSARIRQSQMFPLGVAMFVGTAAVVLAVAFRRLRREARPIQDEISAIEQARDAQR